MALIAKQFPSRIAVATTKEGSQKIAEINFDPLDPAIDHILKDGITFENDAVRLLSCRALDLAVPLVRLRLSNLPFLKEDILKEQLKMSLESLAPFLIWGYYENPTPAPSTTQCLIPPSSPVSAFSSLRVSSRGTSSMEERIRRQGTNEAVRHRLIAEGKAEDGRTVDILQRRRLRVWRRW